ncbi:hypothetical protein BOX15_Mlig032335g1 [Macrostomum lignano]|uniref:Uncharacterized protein n=1 Tax=Macrostomum lignano TaxID=282301 RepID=A0A267H3Q8_9PLAT|nr:hypothetical protein BOX15_Mlig032335g1 [Macrostomum lignano]
MAACCPAQLGMLKVCAICVPKLLAPDADFSAPAPPDQIPPRGVSRLCLDGRRVDVESNRCTSRRPKFKASSGIAPMSPPPLEAKTVPSMKKRMGTIFWDRKRVLLSELPEKRTVTRDSCHTAPAEGGERGSKRRGADIQKLPERWAKCISLRGNFVEKVQDD